MAKKMKNILLMALSLVLVAALAVGGTVAYLTSEDSDVNVMTLGNVKIRQHEYQRQVNENGEYVTGTVDGHTSYMLEPFTQNKPLYPIVGDPNEPGDSPAYAGWDDTRVYMAQVGSYGNMQVFAGKNAQDKFVTVENTGKSDAYVRTLVAFEIGETDGSKVAWSARGAETHDGSAPWLSTRLGSITIGGNKYLVMEYLYMGAKLSNGSWRHENGVLPAGDTTYPNLSQVYLKHNATNEDMEKLDGNKNGTFDILVLSQAVQTNGFNNATAAFEAAFPKGENNANVPGWFANLQTVVATPESGATRPAGYNPLEHENKNLVKNITVIDNSDEKTNLRALYTGDGKKVNGDLKVENCYLDGTYAMNVIGDDTGDLTVVNTDLRGWVSYDGFETATFTNCTFAQNSNPELCNTVRPYSAVTFVNCEFDGTAFMFDKLPEDAKVTFENCTMNGEALTAEVIGAAGNASIIIK